MRKADPFAIRFVNGLRKPKYRILGHEFAGEVVKTGKNVTRFKEGDKVFGSTGIGGGAYAEYLTIDEGESVAKLPTGMPMDEAASLPVGGLTALYFLKKARIQKGQEVLIHGASGSIGTAAVQLAKYFGAVVTAVCSTRNLEFVKSLGADKVIDYSKTEFSEAGGLYDVVFNTVGKTSFAQSKKVLSPTGTYIASDAPGSDYLSMAIPGRKGKRKIILGMAGKVEEGLQFIGERVSDGSFKPVIDRSFNLEQMAEAHTYVEKGHKRGNVVVRVAS